MRMPRHRSWLTPILMISTLAAVAQSPLPPALPLAKAYVVAYKGAQGSGFGETAQQEQSSAPGATNTLPDAPSAISQPEGRQDRVVSSEQPASRPPRAPANTTVGTTFLLANGLLFGSSILNAEMIARCRPGACQAVPDAIRNRGDLYGIAIPSSLAVTYISYRLKRSGTRMWVLPVALFTVGNVVYAAHAAQFSTRSVASSTALHRR